MADGERRPREVPRALDRSEAQLKVGAGADPAMLAQLACTRGSLLLQQGLLSQARAELATAVAAWSPELASYKGGHGALAAEAWLRAT